VHRIVLAAFNGDVTAAPVGELNIPVRRHMEAVFAVTMIDAGFVCMGM
jgi:hypothetical protein